MNDLSSIKSLQREVNSLPWHHQIDFGHGIYSPGNTKSNVLAAQADVYFKDIIEGKSFIDIGCWDGFNSFEAARRGASRVLATDHFAWSDACWGQRESFELGRKHLAPNIEVMDIDLSYISPKTVGEFDIALFAGVFYHLRHPFKVLEDISKIVRSTLIVETHLDALEEQRPSMIFYPKSELANDDTNWWGPNIPCVVAMLKDVGFAEVEVHAHPTEDNRGIFRAHR